MNLMRAYENIPKFIRERSGKRRGEPLTLREMMT
jgi:hypothetical protein